MMIRFNTDREDFLDDTAAEITIEAPDVYCAFLYDEEEHAADDVKRFWELGSMFENRIADLENENAALTDALAQAQKK